MSAKNQPTSDGDRRPESDAGQDPFAELKKRADALRAFAQSVSPDPEFVEALSRAPRACIPCPACEGVNELELSDPPTQKACQRCGAPIDPARPFSVRLRTVDEVIGGTTASLVLVATTPDHPVSLFTQFMVPALRLSRGRFVVAEINIAAEPAAIAHLELTRAPAMVFYTAGVRTGAFELPPNLSKMSHATGSVGGVLKDLLAGATGHKLGATKKRRPAEGGPST